MTGLYVLTSARAADDPWAYLRRTVEQIDREDLPNVDRVLFIDGEHPPLTVAPTWARCSWSRPPGALPGNKLPYWALLEYAKHDDLVVLEDDLELCINAARRMVTFPVPGDLAWVQFFSPKLFRQPDTVIGLWRPPMGTSEFAQAIKFPAPTLRRLVDWRYTDPFFGKFNGSDDALNLAAQRLGLRYGAHAPELVQHVGEVSTVQPQGLEGRVSKTYSPTLDAMKLYARDDLYR